MTERLLQYLWQFQYYNKQSSILDNGDTFQVIHPGRFNTNQGPDFLEAKIRIEETLWVGHVEVHVKTSDWFRHAHQFDRNYDNVVLHVVWEHDLPERDTRIPVFSMQSRVPMLLLEQYEYWMNSASFIACGSQIRDVSRIIWISWRERLLGRTHATQIGHGVFFSASNQPALGRNLLVAAGPQFWRSVKF